jgi:hypothetical protein
MQKISSVFSVIVLALSTQAFALESYYVVNPLAAKGVIELEYSQNQSDLTKKKLGNWGADKNTSESARTFRLNYSRMVKNWTVSGGTSFLTRNVSSDEFYAGTATGFGDLHLAAKSGTVFETLTLTYGSLLQLSPGPAQDPQGRNEYRYQETIAEKKPGNNFSGFNVASPFVGLESYVDEIAVGGRLIAHFFSAQSIDDANADYKSPTDARSFHLEAFTEIPVYSRWDIGLVASVGRSDSPFGGYFQGDNEYKGQIYTQMKIDKNMAATLSLTSTTQKIPLEKSSTEAAIGFRRSM